MYVCAMVGWCVHMHSVVVWYALGYELVWLWLRTGIPLVTKCYGSKRFGYEMSRNHTYILYIYILLRVNKNKGRIVLFYRERMQPRENSP